MERISKVESRASVIVSKTDFREYFSGGEVRIDMLYLDSDTTQHIIVTSGVGYYQTEGKPIEVIKTGDVVWVPKGLKHWHGASSDIAMTHLVVTSVDENGKNVQWFDRVSDEQYNRLLAKPKHFFCAL